MRSVKVANVFSVLIFAVTGYFIEWMDDPLAHHITALHDTPRYGERQVSEIS